MSGNLLTALSGSSVFFIVWLALGGLVFCSSRLTAQEPLQKEPDLHQLVQELFPVQSEESSYEELVETFSQRNGDPLDINEATYEALAGLLFLTDLQITSLLRHRGLSGPFLSLYELQAVEGWDLLTIRHVLPFISVKAHSASLRQSLRSPTQHFLMLRTQRIPEKQQGFAPLVQGSRATTRYAGTPWQWYARYRYAKAGSFSLGLTMEKDAGERLNWTPKRHIFGPDFTSFHLQVMNRGKLKSLVLGDFQLQAGQGVILSSGFSLGKGAETIRTVYRSTSGLKPYTSVMEQGFFRGLAFTVAAAPSLDITSFCSYNRRDATLGSPVSGSSTPVITSFPLDGYHRTPTEQGKHGNISEKNTGIHIHYNPKQSAFRGGITLLHTSYSIPVKKRNLPYNQYEFSGTSQTIAGIHASYRFRNLHFFSESARSQSRGAGYVGGMAAALSKYWDTALLFRHYQKNFHTFYGYPFKESSRPINESGIYIGLRFSPSRKWQYSAYTDYFHFPWKRYQVDTASSGLGYLLHAQWKPHKRFRAIGLLQAEYKQRNNPDTRLPHLPLTTYLRRVAMLTLEWNHPLRYHLRTRIQGGDFRYLKQTPSKGIAVAQDAGWIFKKLEISGRIAIFGTDDYDSRQYISEKDVLYAFSLPSYNQHGTRHYLMVRYTFFRRLKLWLRWAQTRYRDLDAIGSGLNEIRGNTKSEVKMQWMYHF